MTIICSCNVYIYIYSICIVFEGVLFQINCLRQKDTRGGVRPYSSFKTILTFCKVFSSSSISLAQCSLFFFKESKNTMLLGRIFSKHSKDGNIIKSIKPTWLLARLTVNLSQRQLTGRPFFFSSSPYIGKKKKKNIYIYFGYIIFF